MHLAIERLEDRDSPTTLFGQVFLTGSPPFMPPPPAPQPYANHDLWVERLDGTILAKVHTNSHGRFHLHLKPGTYQLVASLNTKFPPFGADQFVVPPHGHFRMTFLFDSGIR
jgi:hypothetical protein